MCLYFLNFFNKNKNKNMNMNKVLPYSVCSHCCHNSNNVIYLKCGHLICTECLQVVNIMTNEEKDLCIVCARDLVRSIIFIKTK